REDCGDLGAAKRKILDATKEGRAVSLTQELPFELQLKVGEPGAEVKKTAKTAKTAADAAVEEAIKSETNPDKPESD
ncbi:unnamed protein product, partial [marine sediment metagenome]